MVDLDAGGLGEGGLVGVEGEEEFGVDLQSDGNVEEVHAADGEGGAVLDAELVGAADGIDPAEFDVGEVAQPNLSL